MDLFQCTNITDAAFIALATHCPSLKSITLYNGYNITDAAVIALATHCPSLTSIHLRSGSGHLYSFLRQIRSDSPRLRRDGSGSCL